MPFYSRLLRLSSRANNWPALIWIFVCALFFASTGGIGSALAQGSTPDGNLSLTAPPAGSALTNRAFVTFEVSGQPVRIDSNTVSVSIIGVPDLTLTPNIERNVTAGAPVALAHRLTNTGNVATAYTLQPSSLTGDGYDLTNVRVGLDANGNGVLDSGEQILDVNTPIYLNAGASANLVLVGVVPNTVAPGSVSRTRLTATVAGPAPGAPAGDFPAVSASVADTLTIAAGADILVSKSASVNQTTRGGEVTFTAIARNNGTVSPLPQNIQVDGSLRAFVLLRDTIPANSQFVELTSPQSGALRLYHRIGDAPDSYLTIAPTANQVDSVAIALNSLEANAAVTLILRVRVSQTASGSIRNTAFFSSISPVSGGVTQVPSNEVTVTLPQRPPTLEYYTGTDYSTLAGITTVGRPLYLQGEASVLNRDPSVAETVTITVVSRLTGDRVTVTAIETGPNTGIFRVVTPIPTNGDAADTSDGILSIRENDTLEAVLEDGIARAIADILVDPFGVVFDSRTNAPVAGATVTLIDVTGAGNGGNAGGPARVLDVDGVTVISATIITGADGAFQYPLVAGSTYRLQITPPAPYTFPSKVSVFLLPVGRRIDPAGSYGGNFRVDGITGPIQIDVPLDPPPPSGLFLQKTASRSTAEIADFVDYQLRLRNTTGSALSSLTITDVLPRGFSLVGGTVRQNGTAIPNPAGSPGPTLTFNVGTLAPDAEVRLTYRLRIGAGVSSGENRNRAVANGTTILGPVTSNTAIATVRVSSGVLTERAILFGKVFVDANKNRIEDKGELGVSGVRIWIEDGTYAITDSDGKYSIYGLTANTHVVKADKVTLPQDAILAPLTVRHGGRGDSAFADLKKAELHKVNFAIVDTTPEMLAEIEKRRAAGDPFGAEINPTLQADLRSTINDVTPDPRSLPATGTLSASGPVAGSTNPGGSFDSLNPRGVGVINTSPNGNNAGTFSVGGNVVVPGQPLNPLNSNLPRAGEVATAANPVAPVAPATVEGGTAQFEAELKDLDNKLAVLSPATDALLPTDQANIRVKSPNGASLILRVNGEVVPESRIGARITDAERNIQAFEYIGVRFKAGKNTIELVSKDTFGNERERVALEVNAPGRAAKLVIEAPKSASADGASGVPIVLKLVDAKGLPVTSRVPLTLETASGRFDIEDLNNRESGTQVFIEGGVLKINLITPAEPGDGLIRAMSGSLEARQKISFLPELRPLIAVGSVEGGVNFYNFKPQGVSGDLFEDDLKGLYNKELGNTTVSSRAALFLKGRVAGKNLLTLSYDSQKTKDRLFRDIQPDEYYPVYGDGALKGFDAQSSGKLYVRLDRDRNYFLFGDFTTASATQFNTLGNYQRSLNGVRQHLENEKYTLDLFGARDNGRQVVDEIRGNGTSSGYTLRTGSLLENSERVEIIVRDRNNLGSILEVRPQSRFTDYEFDFDTGRILFRSPVPTFDANFNPIFVRVFYEVDSGGPKFWVQGINGAVKITPNLEIGASYVRDQDPQDKLNLSTINATYKVGENTTIAAELAQSKRDSLGSGNGSRVEVIHDTPQLQARFFAGRTTEGFDNPGAILSRGRNEVSLRANWRLDEKTRLLTEALRTGDTATGDSRFGLQASLEREIGKGMRAEIGIRRAKKDSGSTLNGIGAAPVDFTSVRARLTVPAGTRANLFGEYETDINDTSRRVLAFGGDYRLNERSRLYARHELLSSLDGRFALNDSQDQQKTLFGIDTSYSQTGHLFSEYRLGGSLSGREGQAAIGVRDAWSIADGIKVLGGFERTKSMSGGTQTGINNDSTAITGGLEYTRSENFKGTTRLELRDSSQSNSVLGTFGLAQRINPKFTMLSRGVFNLQRGKDGQDDAAQHRFQLGLSYRDRENDRWSGLAKYEFRKTQNGTAAGATLPGEDGILGNNNSTIHLFSLDANYQPSARLTVSGHLGAKYNSDGSNGISSKTWAQLAGGRAIYELNRKTEVSVQGAVLKTKGAGIQTGIGAELGRLIGRDLWLSAGYNSGAVSDGDLTGSGYSRKGAYLRIRFKFDESLFGSREAKMLAKSDEKKVEPSEAGSRVVNVPVVGVNPKTQEKTTLPVTADVEVSAGTEAPKSVEVDVPATVPTAVVTGTEVPKELPLNPRIVEASGKTWNFKVDMQEDARRLEDYYAEDSRLRRANLAGNDFGSTTQLKPKATVKPAQPTKKVQPISQAPAAAKTVKPVQVEAELPPVKMVAAHPAAVVKHQTVKRRVKAHSVRRHVAAKKPLKAAPNRAWWLK